MAITRHLAELLLAEHRFQPIIGNVLLLGRQEVYLSPHDALALVRKHGIEPQGKIETGDFGVGLTHGYISDRSFFSLFTGAKVVACDVTDHEHADLIFDLSSPLPSDVLQRFDFIYNGSVFDNVFDPAGCIRNAARMLTPNGRLMGYEGMVHYRTSFAYCRFSPEWYFDYFAINEFADVQCYVASFTDFHKDRWALYEWSPYAEEHFAGDLTVDAELASIFVAQKAPQSTFDRSPVQNYYRPDQAPYRQASLRTETSPRRQHYRKAFPPRRQFWPKRLPRGYRSLGFLG